MSANEFYLAAATTVLSPKPSQREIYLGLIITNGKNKNQG